MKIIVAPNAFKDSVTAFDAAAAIADGVRRVLPEAEIISVPVADGGDGLFDVMMRASNGTRVRVSVSDPLFRTIEADFLSLDGGATAFIEMAKASGLALLGPGERDARKTTSLGAGELARHAVRHGAKRLIIGIGGSATNDCGIGFATPFGIKFLDEKGDAVLPVGGNLMAIKDIDLSGLDPLVRDVSFEAVCDVDNPLFGPRGAAHVFGPQKGADENAVKELDAGLRNVASVIKRCLGIDVDTLPGGGSAGGMGAGLAAFFKASLKPGIDVVLDFLQFDRLLEGAGLVLTAEGCLDYQTAFGKGPAGVAARAKREGIPCLALAGTVKENIDNLHDLGIDAAFSICNGPMTLDQAIANAAPLLSRATAQAVRAFMSGWKRCAVNNRGG